MEVSKEYKLGLLVFIGSILVFIAVNFMKSVANFGRSDEYYAIFENASGLKPGSEVQLSGVKIGEVLEVGLHPDNPMLILTRFSIENTEIQIPRSSEAWLVSVDLVGTKCIDLRLDTSSTASAELLAHGDTLNAKTEMTLEEEFMMQLDPLKTKTEKLISRIEDIIIEVNKLWDSSASYTFEESIYKAREAIGTYRQLVHNLTDLINRETQMVTTIVGNVNVIKDSILQNMNAISSVAQNVTFIKGEINTSGLLIGVADLNVSLSDLNGLIAGINNGEGTLGALTKSPEFKNSLKSTKESLNLLLANITADPMKYIGLSLLGKKIDGVILTPEEEEKLENWLAE